MYWTRYKDRDSPINGFAAVAVDDLIYSFSNHCYSNKPIAIHILNTHTLMWSLLSESIDINSEPLEPPHVPASRIGYTVVAYDKKIYLWGGESDEEEITNTLYCFDTKTLNWSRPQVSGIIPSARCDHSACISKHQMYIFGGYDLDMNDVLSDIHCLDLKTMNWSNIITTGAIPSPRKFHAATIVNNFMYIFGGCGNDETVCFTDTMYLDLKSNRWNPPETTSRELSFKIGYCLFVHNNIIYVFGGYTDLGNDLCYFDTKRNHWNLIKSREKSPKQRDKQSCIVIGDEMFFLREYGWGDPYSPVGQVNSVYVLDFNPSLKTLATMLIIENGLDVSCLPKKLRSEIDSMRQHLDHILQH